MEAVNNATLTDAEKERLTKNAETQIDDNLKKLNQMMHDGLHIEANSRVHLMAGMIMAGLGVESKVAALELSDLHGYTTASGHDGRVFMNRITDSLRERGLPEEKREIVLNKLSTVFVNAQGLWMPENGVSRLKTLYAEVQRTILPYARTKGSQYLDFTGRLFNVLTDWVTIPDGDKNDVVLTPRYITNLMARLCEVDRDSSVWDYATGTAGFLVSSMRLMIEDSVDVIVFEHLSFTGKKHGGSKAQKLSMWKRNSIQDYVEHKAHRCGIRISRICAWGTSKLAFDGSGALERDETNRALATFASGKQYNCDLSASYNIGARYFVRELLKPLPAMVRSQLSANVPDVERRIQVTLATLKVLYPELKKLSTQAA